MVYSKEVLIKYAILLIVVVLVFVIPESILFNEAHSVCLHYRFLGFQCPLCGLTRSAWELMHFQIFEALQHNFNSILILLYFIFDLAFVVKGKVIFKKLRKLIAFSLVIGLLTIYGVRIAMFL